MNNAPSLTPYEQAMANLAKMNASQVIAELGRYRRAMAGYQNAIQRMKEIVDAQLEVFYKANRLLQQMQWDKYKEYVRHVPKPQRRPSWPDPTKPMPAPPANPGPPAQ